MKKKRKLGIIAQVAILFALAIVANGIMTYFIQRSFSENAVKKSMETAAAQCADDAIFSLTEYPAYEWLIKYWYDHPDELDIEYDVDFRVGTKTEEKSAQFAKNHPDIPLRYATSEEISALSPEEQKLYAEIVYSWVLTRMNQIKRTYKMDYLFVVIANRRYDEQFFLMSAAEEGAHRGTTYEDAYTLGHVVEVSRSQQDAMIDAKRFKEHLADAGDYLDYYVYYDSVYGHAIYIGLTYNLVDIKASVNEQTRASTALALLFQIVLSAIFLLVIYLFVLRPVKKVNAAVHVYEDTKDSAAVKESLAAVKVRNEIGQLGDSVGEMAAEIDDYVNKIENITAERERIEAELNLASRIQANSVPNIFPPFPERNEFDLYATMDPAKQVGGDFYDFFLVDDDHLAFLIADVSGKGVPAALFMMIAMVIIHNYTTNNTSPKEVLEIVNERICSRNPEEMFISVWLGILEISTGKLTASNAGHEYPIIKQPGETFEILKDKHGLVIGAMDGVKYTNYTIDLKPGAQVLIYTDGVPEATNAQEKMFGLDRLVIAANRSDGSSPQNLLETVRAEVDEFVQDAEQFDDLTMVGLEYRGKTEEEKLQ